MVRYGIATGEMMVVFVTRTADFPQKQQVIEQIIARFPHVRSIVQNVNSKKTNVIFGDETTVLWGRIHL